MLLIVENSFLLFSLFKLVSFISFSCFHLCSPSSFHLCLFLSLFSPPCSLLSSFSFLLSCFFPTLSFLFDLQMCLSSVSFLVVVIHFLLLLLLPFPLSHQMVLLQCLVEIHKVASVRVLLMIFTQIKA